uniref:Uncharacterized protein n=1 Tax=Arundo donax TaxID=35708 RepID=A0A0A9FWA7_ARUDO
MVMTYDARHHDNFRQGICIEFLGYMHCLEKNSLVCTASCHEGSICFYSVIYFMSNLLAQLL